MPPCAAFSHLAAALLVALLAPAAPALAAWTWPLQGEVITGYLNGDDPYSGRSAPRHRHRGSARHAGRGSRRGRGALRGHGGLERTDRERAHRRRLRHLLPAPGRRPRARGRARVGRPAAGGRRHVGRPLGRRAAPALRRPRGREPPRRTAIHSRSCRLRPRRRPRRPRLRRFPSRSSAAGGGAGAPASAKPRSPRPPGSAAGSRPGDQRRRRAGLRCRADRRCGGPPRGRPPRRSQAPEPAARRVIAPRPRRAPAGRPAPAPSAHDGRPRHGARAGPTWGCRPRASPRRRTARTWSPLGAPRPRSRPPAPAARTSAWRSPASGCCWRRRSLHSAARVDPRGAEEARGSPLPFDHCWGGDEPRRPSPLCGAAHCRIDGLRDH